MKLNYCLLILTLLVSCVSESNKSEYVNKDLKIDINDIHSFDFNSVYDSTRYVSLELTDNSMIQNIDKLYKADSFYIVFDSKQMNIFLFSLDGKYERTIGNKGSGINEYVYWNDIYYDKDENLIYAHERFQNCIYVYTVLGDLLYKTKKSRFHFNSFVKTSSGFYVYSCFKKPYNLGGYNLLLLDHELQDAKEHFFSQEEFVNAVVTPTFFMYENEIAYFYYPSSNIVYELKDEKPIPFCKLDFGKQTLPYDEIVQLGSLEAYEKMVSNNGYYGDIQFFKRNEKWIYFQFAETDFNKPIKNYYCMYNVENEKMYIDSSPFFNLSEYPFHRSLKYIDDSVGIYLMYHFVFTKQSLSMLSKCIGTEISNDSNPILVVAYLKK